MKLAIVHYQPIEHYPPTINFLDYLTQNTQNRVHVYTTTYQFSNSIYANKKLKISRFSFPFHLANSLFRLLGYIFYNYATLYRLIIQNPDVVIYYESYSAYPVYKYFKWFGKNKKLWMHSHEYFPPEWYEQGMRTVKLYHKYEVDYLYKIATGLSQTNRFRAEFFMNDYPFINPSKIHVIKNLPQPFWLNYQREIKQINYPIKIIYIGAISLWANHLNSFCNWIINNNGKVLFDVYTRNIDSETKIYFSDLNSPYIRLYPTGIHNKDIPSHIKNEGYHIGVILYKGLFTNTAWCASDKLFEYLNCGLDVWFTKDMPGTYEYITENTYPIVLKQDFSDMKNFDIESSISHKGKTFKPFKFNCNDEYDRLMSLINTANNS